MEKTQSTIYSISSKDNTPKCDTYIQNVEPKPLRELNTKYIKQHPNNSMFDLPDINRKYRQKTDYKDTSHFICQKRTMTLRLKTVFLHMGGHLSRRLNIEQ